MGRHPSYVFDQRIQQSKLTRDRQVRTDLIRDSKG